MTNVDGVPIFTANICKTKTKEKVSQDFFPSSPRGHGEIIGNHSDF